MVAAESTEGVRVAVWSKVEEILSYSLMAVTVTIRRCRSCRTPSRGAGRLCHERELERKNWCFSFAYGLDTGARPRLTGLMLTHGYTLNKLDASATGIYAV